MAGNSPLTKPQLVLTAVYLFGCPALVFALAGDLGWSWGWAFAAWFVGFTSACIIWLYRKDPALLAERYRSNGTGAQEAWDRYVFYALNLLIWAWLIVMPLDGRRFHWTPDWPIWTHLAGGLALVPASFLLFRAITDNTFLSPLVRHQAEREHKVVSTGVYGFVRHPMYLGGLVGFAAVPLLLGSAVGLVVCAPAVLVLVVRILGEERMLVRELAGYSQYQQRVRYRLLPLVW